MKVSVITRHAITNYGSLLQALATQTVIEQLGHTCEIIDYIREDETYTRSERTLLRQKPEWNRNPLKRFAYLALRQPWSVLSGRRFEKEREKLLKLSRLYSSPEELREEPPAADIYLTGSDQVWGPVEDGSYDSGYCLSFAPEEAKKASYAASFGHAELTEEQKTYFRKWLCRYDRLTVRETSAVKLLEGLGLCAEQVLDPTLLLDAQYWSRFMKPIRKKRYILVYQIHHDEALGEYARKVAKSRHLPLIRISASFHQFFREGKLVWCPPVGEFLSYIRNAECLITDSFHGTAFAINFNTPFVEVLPKNNTGTRNMSILSLTGLSDRILKDQSDMELPFTKMDFEFANHVLAENRKRSLAVLESMLRN